MAALVMIFYSVGAVTAVSGVLAFLLVIAERYLADYGECNIDINAGGKNLTVKGGASLLSSLGREKIFLPSACGGRGTCGYCKCKVLDGVGPVLPTEEPLLDEDEKASNVRIACQVKVKQDIKIEIPEELFNIKEFKTTVEVLEDLTYDIKLLRLKLNDPPEINFKAGQYAQLYTKPYDDVKESINRAYSIASPSSEKNYIDLMVRLVPEGICTTWVHKHLKQGDEVKVVGPMGDFRLHDGEGEMVMVAGGSGMAPIASLLAEIVEKKIERKITYFFGAVTKKDLFYMEEMAAFEKQIPNYKFAPALSGDVPEDEWDGERGLITLPLENYLKQRDDNSKVQAYMCGSPGMINACVGVLTKNGVQGSNIFFDPFA
jgi:Na+-transporting NADH:ubiquinone oxidoreductase subunit F